MWRSKNKRTHILFLLFDNLDSKQAVFQWVDHYQYISKLCLENGAPVVSPVFTPNNVNFVIPQMTYLHSIWWHVNDITITTFHTSTNTAKPNSFTADLYPGLLWIIQSLHHLMTPLRSPFRHESYPIQFNWVSLPKTGVCIIASLLTAFLVATWEARKIAWCGFTLRVLPHSSCFQVTCKIFISCCSSLYM